ncbi:hypothetical protein GCM10029992_54400 [Glycomyces albus]
MRAGIGSALGRGLLAGATGLGQDPVAKPLRRLGHRDVGQAPDCFAQLGDLAGAGLAFGEVLFDQPVLVLVDRVEHVGSDQAVDVGAHRATSRQSRSLMRPSRMRDLIVGSAVSSRVATCR